jgi:TonB family protein
MRPQSFRLIFLLWILLGLFYACFAQESSARKLLTHAAPEYPKLARVNHLAGSVKIEATVLPNGTVRAVRIRGGTPILSEAAADAVLKWKWAPAAHETREPVEVNFGDH